MQLDIRWLIRRDMTQVMEIEEASYEMPWTIEEFLCQMRQRNCIGMVAERGEHIVGFMVYELHKNSLHIVNLAVHPDHRHEYIGSAMVEKLLHKLSAVRRRQIGVDVRETNLGAQLFFKRCGFRCVGVERSLYENGEDAYRMRYELGGEPVNQWERVPAELDDVDLMYLDAEMGPGR